MKRRPLFSLSVLALLLFLTLSSKAHAQVGGFPDKTDLGDAPASQNHFGNLPMTAYPSVVANYPTVFDGATPPGPMHFNNPLIMHLGPGISGEREADIGPDADVINNLDVDADIPDLDNRDDGLELPDQFPHCEPFKLDYQLSNLGLVAGFDDVYINVWLDWDRSGNWGETFDCPDTTTTPGGVASEWAVQNHVVTLGAPGVLNLSTPVFLTHNPSPDRPMWIRISVSEKPAPNADGRGNDEPYFWGETEDYLWNETPIMVGIHGVKWHDLDGDGVWDSNEPTIPDWPIYIEGDNGYDEQTHTDQNGHYWFTQLQPATYTIGEGMLPGWVQTYPSANSNGVHVIDFDGTTNFENINFGNQLDAPCGPMDVAFVIDDTGSMYTAIDNVKASLPSIVSLVDTITGGDYQLSLVTFKDDINVDLDWTTSAPAFNAAVVAVNASGGWAWPEASDEALNTVINELAMTGRPQDADFGVTGSWRAAADHRMIILVTDAPPAGFDDTYTVGTDDVNANLRAIEAATAAVGPIKISAVQVGSNALVAPIMSNYAMVTGGEYISTPDGSFVSTAIQQILEDCGGDEETGIHGQKFHDINGNGVQDDNEPGIPDWTIELRDPATGAVLYTTTTDEHGHYWFMPIEPGTYLVAEVQQPGWAQTFPQTPGTYTITIEEGEQVFNIDFGNIPNELGQICGYKFWDINANGEHDAASEPLLPDWTILLQLPDGTTISTVTDEEGRYCFDELVAGDYMLAELHDMSSTGPGSSPAWTQTTPVAGTEFVTLGVGQTLNVPFGNHRQGIDQHCFIKPQQFQFGSTAGPETVQVAISNNGALSDPTYNYNVQMIGLPAGIAAPGLGTSAQDGSTTFNILTPLTISVAPMTVAPVDVEVNYPPGMAIGGGWAFYQAIVTNVDTDETFGCIAAMWPPTDDGGGIDDPDLPDITIGTATPMTISWPIINSGNGTLTIAAKVSVVAPDSTRGGGGISVNGEAVGDSAEFTLTIPVADSEEVPVTIEATDGTPSGEYTVVFEIDDNGDGKTDAASTANVTVDASTPTAATLAQADATIAQPIVLLAALLTAALLTGNILRKRRGY